MNTRELIYIIARHSNWKTESIRAKLKETQVYPDAMAWLQFIKVFLIGLGTAFLGAGILFFFAYNWADLPKFGKLGLLEFLVVSLAAAVLFARISPQVKDILLTLNSVLVGILFAVFGQIYQSGANTYDLFLIWTVSIFLWVLVSGFQPLWLLFICLVNTTIALYANQVAIYLASQIVLDILFLVNAGFLLVWQLLAFKDIVAGPANWFIYILGLAALSFLTVSLILGIFNSFNKDAGGSLILAMVFYGLGIWYGIKGKNVFYLGSISFSIIMVLAAGIIRLGEESFVGIFLLVSLFVILSITGLVHQIMQLNRRWYGQK